MRKQLSLFDNAENIEQLIPELSAVENNEAKGDNNKDFEKTTSLELTKQYYSIGEVAQIFKVNTSLLRFWEKEFPALFIKLKKNKKGDRFYTPKDIHQLKVLFQLIKEQKMTLEGARNYLKKNKKKLSTEKSLTENLQQIKRFLVDLKSKIQ